MLLRKTILKTKNFYNKTLRNFKAFIFGGYRKLKRAPSLSFFSSSINNPKMQQLDNFYKQFCEQWDSDGQNAQASEQEDIESNRRIINSEQRVLNNKILAEEKDAGSSNYVNGGTHNVLERKMKELEMMDVKDEEHALDVEEVLHYYSLLTSPIYQDLVDKFFTDMYSEFNRPIPPTRSNSLNSSLRRLGPLKI